jgi:acetyltransferase-like isoleucine patch superfamily enzyme
MPSPRSILRRICPVADAATVPTLREAPARGLGPGLQFIWRNRMFTPRYWVLGLRYLWRFKVRNRHIRTRGMVFVARRAAVSCTRGLGQMELGRWVWIGNGNAIRCHEGFVGIGDKVVFGSNDTVDAYLDVVIGAGTLVADSVYVTDFDHRYEDPITPIRKQGIVTARVQIGADCWIGEKASILRGSTIGSGSVIGSQTVVKGDIPPNSVAVGAPARIVKQRGIPDEGATSDA